MLQNKQELFPFLYEMEFCVEQIINPLALKSFENDVKLHKETE